jgi:uncharacterized membrane protein HdeD (DUF308 family)
MTTTTGSSMPLQDTQRRAVTFFIIEAVVLYLLGAAAIFLPFLAGIAVTIFLGWLFLVGGVIGLISSFATRHMAGLPWSLISAFLAIAAGVLLVGWPARGLVSVTLVLIVFFTADGLTSVFLSVAHKSQFPQRWGWMLASGIVTLVLAGIIAFGLPGSAAWALGIIVGVDMVMAASALLALGLAVRST